MTEEADLPVRYEDTETVNENPFQRLFDQLDEFGAGEMYLTTQDEDGKVLTAIIVAKGENAEALMVAYKAWEAKDET